MSARNTKIQEILKWEAESRKATPKDKLERRRLVHHLASMGNMRTHSKVLSVGCGTGYYELILKRRIERLYCLDISKEMLLICKNRNLKNLIQAGSHYLPFKPDIFDSTYALSLSPVGSKGSNAYSRGTTLKEMKRITKRGGRIIIGHPTTLWKQFHGLLRHKSSNYDPFSVSPKKVRASYLQNDIAIQRSMVLPPIPYAILRWIDNLKVDRILSHLLLDEVGPYLLISGVK
jgi:SAM-dependent methyltransferase